MTQSVICIAQGHITVKRAICLVVNRYAVADVGAWLSALDEYDRDEDAYADGVPLNGWYRAGSMHDQIKWGTPTQVKVI